MEIRLPVSAGPAMNVRFVTPPAAKQSGGLENAIEGLREALRRRGVRVSQGGDLSDLDAVHHFHGLWEPAHSALAARLRRLGYPYVVSPHGMLEPWAFRNRRWKKLPYFWLVERRFLLGARTLFVTSELEADHLGLVVRHPMVKVLPLACRDRRAPDYENSKRFLGWPSEERVMLFLSRIHPKKGLDLLLQALAQGNGSWSGWRLVVVGDGDSGYLNSLKKLASTLEKELPKVEWIGPVWGPERWRYLQGSDLFCLPTHSENFGIAVLESLHVGTPVLTSDQTPWKDHAHEDGFFVVRPEIDSIAGGLGRARNRLTKGWTGTDREGLAAWAEKRFSWDNLAGSYLEAYKAAAGRGGQFPPDTRGEKR